MDETILFPSPNWFQVSGLAITSDGWLIYGGPSKSLCVLQPVPSSYDAVVSGPTGYKAHVSRGHPEKVTSVDVSSEWPEKRAFLSGSADGSVKQWLVSEQDNNVLIKTTLIHDVHSNEKEEIVGVGYSTETFAITVGSFGNLVKWNTNSNITETYGTFLRSFKPTCMSCSPHIPLNVAVGTKQGVVFVIDLSGSGKLLYKIRGHEDEIMQLNWCPQYKVEVRKSLQITLASRLERIRNKSEPSNNEDNLSKVVTAEQFASIDFKTSENLNSSDISLDKKLEDLNKSQISNATEGLNSSEGPNSTVVEEDLFDMYKDHAAEEFGHKKYEPEDIFVKVKSEDTEPNDFLAECLKLKDDIIKNKIESEATIESLVDALDKTHVDQATAAKAPQDDEGNDDDEETCRTDDVSSIHIYRHLLATIAKQGSIRIWSKSGKMVSAGSVHNNNKSKSKMGQCMTLLWYKPDCMLIADGKNQLLECNPLKVDSKTKLEWHILNSLHRRGFYCIASGAPRVQTGTDTDKQHWPVWTAAQDRNMVEYCVKERKALAVHATCGSYVYSIAVCPYDAKKVAVSVSDGAVRVWEADTLPEDDSKLSAGHVAMYWQNVQGKVYAVAWHPTRENVLAFATAEARVGLIDTSGKLEKPARVLRPALSNAVYGLCWGERNTLYACGGGELVAYQADRPDEAPEHIKVEVDGAQWRLSEVVWSERALLLGSMEGAVAALTAAKPHTVITVAFAFTKLIHSIDWHPQQVSESSEQSPNKDLIAVCSLDKNNTIVILQLSENEEGEIKLSTYKTLSGHKQTVHRVCWNPHREGLLLSSSQDHTVRVWNVLEGVCTSIFAGHNGISLGVAWSGHPALWDLALSGGGDQSVRMWRIKDHLAENYIEPEANLSKKDKRRINKAKGKESKDKENNDKENETKEIEKATENDKTDKDETEIDQLVAANRDPTKLKSSKRFLLPRIHKQIMAKSISALRIILDKYKEKNALNGDGDKNGDFEEVSGDLVKNGDSAEIPGVVVRNGDTKLVSEGGNTNGFNKEVTGDVVKSVVTEEESGDEDNSEDINDVKGDGDNKDYLTDFVKIFGSINDVNEIMDKELKHLEATVNIEGYMILCIFRGNIDGVFQFAAQRNLICPYLLSIAPCVSFKYWKDATQMYLTQIDRLTAKGDDWKLAVSKPFGGPVYRKAATLLSVHDVKGAVNVLTEARLFKEAYVLCRVRHMDSIAEETLRVWAKHALSIGSLIIAAICLIVLGDLRQAASVLGRSDKEAYISLAAEIAKLSGQTTFATHCQEKTDKIKSDNISQIEVDEELKKLPTRMELLMKQCEVDGCGDGLKGDAGLKVDD